MDHWRALILHLVAGIRMTVRDPRERGGDTGKDRQKKSPFPLLSLATIIDMTAVGVSFGVLRTDVLIPAFILGASCALILFAGVMLGDRWKNLGKERRSPAA